MKKLHEYETPVTDEIRKAVFQRFDERTEDRPHNSDGHADGSWKFVHNLHARSAFNNQAENIRDIERKLAMCRDALEFIAENLIRTEQGRQMAIEALDQTK